MTKRIAFFTPSMAGTYGEGLRKNISDLNKMTIGGEEVSCTLFTPDEASSQDELIRIATDFFTQKKDLEFDCIFVAGSLQLSIINSALKQYSLKTKTPILLATISFFVKKVQAETTQVENLRLLLVPELDIKKSIQFLLTAKPQVKSVLVPYEIGRAHV